MDTIYCFCIILSLVLYELKVIFYSNKNNKYLEKKFFVGRESTIVYKIVFYDELFELCLSLWTVRLRWWERNLTSWTCSNVMKTYARNFRCCLSWQSASSNIKEFKKKNFKIVRKYVLKIEGGWIWLTVTYSDGADCVGCITREVIILLERLVPYLKE